jgi:TFIIF-interacting CTD phosphatase-like protein
MPKTSLEFSENRSMKNLIVLDLDNCLIYAGYDFIQNSELIAKKGFHYLYHRPNLLNLMNFLEDNFSIVFYTASKKDYAKWVVSSLPLKYKYPVFSRKWTKRKSTHYGEAYLKSIQFFDIDCTGFERVYVLDDRPDLWTDEKNYYFDIDPWMGSGDDEELKRVLEKLQTIVKSW